MPGALCPDESGQSAVQHVKCRKIFTGSKSICAGNTVPTPVENGRAVPGACTVPSFFCPRAGSGTVYHSVAAFSDFCAGLEPAKPLGRDGTGGYSGRTGADVSAGTDMAPYCRLHAGKMDSGTAGKSGQWRASDPFPGSVPCVEGSGMGNGSGASGLQCGAAVEKLSGL